MYVGFAQPTILYIPAESLPAGDYINVSSHRSDGSVWLVTLVVEVMMMMMKPHD